MQVAKLKTLMEVGAIRRITVTYAAKEAGWTVAPTFATANGGEKAELVERQRKGVRVFATLDAAAQFLVSVGIREFSVLTNGKQASG